jgi:Txe/YoeB family toxin of toxin-antitoxin system
MVTYKIFYTKEARDDIPKLKAAQLARKAKSLVEILRVNPYQTPPPFEKLQGGYDGAFSRRINLKHRLVYEVLSNDTGLKDPAGNLYKGSVKILRMWTHYA